MNKQVTAGLIPGGAMAGAVTAPPVPVPLERRRLQCYLALILSDILAIVAGFMIPGWLYLGEAGPAQASRISDLMLPLFLTIGLYNGSYSRGALEQPRTGAMHAVGALAIAAALTIFIAFYTKSSAEFSRFLFGSGMIATGILLVGFRSQMQAFVAWRCGGCVTSQLVIQDNGPPIDLPGAQQIDAAGCAVAPAQSGAPAGSSPVKGPAEAVADSKAGNGSCENNQSPDQSQPSQNAGSQVPTAQAPTAFAPGIPLAPFLAVPAGAAGLAVATAKSAG